MYISRIIGLCSYKTLKEVSMSWDIMVGSKELLIVRSRGGGEAKHQCIICGTQKTVGKGEWHTWLLIPFECVCVYTCNARTC